MAPHGHVMVLSGSWAICLPVTSDSGETETNRQNIPPEAVNEILLERKRSECHGISNF